MAVKTHDVSTSQILTKVRRNKNFAFSLMRWGLHIIITGQLKEKKKKTLLQDSIKKQSKGQNALLLNLKIPWDRKWTWKSVKAVMGQTTKQVQQKCYMGQKENRHKLKGTGFLIFKPKIAS